MKNKKTTDINEDSILHRIKKVDEFKTPADCFDTIKSNVQAEIVDEDSAVFAGNQVKLAFFSFCTIALVVLVYFNVSQDIAIADNDINNLDAQEYLEQNIDEYYDVELGAELSVDEINELQIEDSLKTKSTTKDEFETLTEDEILEFLLEDSDDEDWDEL